LQEELRRMRSQNVSALNIEYRKDEDEDEDDDDDDIVVVDGWFWTPSSE
jgi:hypothetical protein